MFPPENLPNIGSIEQRLYCSRTGSLCQIWRDNEKVSPQAPSLTLSQSAYKRLSHQ